MQRRTQLKKAILISVLLTLMAGSFAAATEKLSIAELVRDSAIIFVGVVVRVHDVDKPRPRRIVELLVWDDIKGDLGYRYGIRRLYLSSEHQSVKDVEGELLFQKLKADRTRNIFFLRPVPDPTFDDFMERDTPTPFVLELIGVEPAAETLVKQIEHIQERIKKAYEEE